MSRNLEPLTPPELGPRKVVSVTPEEGGFDVLLECGHKSWWAIEPPMHTAHCSQCLDEVLERLRKEKHFER
jgi:hypothetical protein